MSIELRRGTVVETIRLTPGMVRVVLGGRELRDFPGTGVGDEYLRLHFPVPGTGEFVLPVDNPEGRGWSYPEGSTPSPCQPYTVRRLDAASGEMTIDFVVHEGGVASEWARTARPGDQLFVGEPRGLYEPPADTVWHLFAADATGLPALGRLVEQLPAHARAHAIVEVAHESHAQRIDAAADVTFTWLYGSGNGVAPSLLPEAVRGLPLPKGPGYVWAAGESTMLRGIRRHLRHGLGLPGHRYKIIGYWTHRAEEWQARYDALDEEVRARLDSVWESGGDEEEIRDEVERTLERAGL
ncbi:siderophore-interacting protein [Streptosporangium saharense]|uniref:siderophore-interacting protein n=1 Tax=Streptosporangium saharense TaxID=1706840 RepID=UPI0036AE08D0